MRYARGIRDENMPSRPLEMYKCHVLRLLLPGSPAGGFCERAYSKRKSLDQKRLDILVSEE